MADASENSAEERNQPATAFRREEFRKRGQVAMSRELLSVFVLGSVGIALYLMSSRLLVEFSSLSARFFTFGPFQPMDKNTLIQLGGESLISWGWMVGPIFLVALVVGVLISAAQAGLYVTWEPLSPNWERLNPVSGFKRLFSSKGFVEAFKAMLKMGIAFAILWSFLETQANGVGAFLSQDVAEITASTLGSVGRLFFTILAALLVLAAADYGFQRWTLEKEMRMTRQETKEEFKLREGDPLIKSRIRGLQRRLASRRMMEDVPKADVIVTNPTHFAIALRYDRDNMPAPKVVAKGAGIIAQKIKELGRSKGVPIVENKPLARALFKQLDIGHYVPRDLFKAVAEVLAYVYRLRGLTQVNYGR